MTEIWTAEWPDFADNLDGLLAAVADALEQYPNSKLEVMAGWSSPKRRPAHRGAEKVHPRPIAKRQMDHRRVG